MQHHLVGKFVYSQAYDTLQDAQQAAAELPTVAKAIAAGPLVGVNGKVLSKKRFERADTVGDVRLLLQ